MSKLLSPAESAELIGKLKAALRQFSARADEIHREFGGRTEAAERKARSSLTEAEQRLVREMSEAAEAYQVEKDSPPCRAIPA